MIHLISFLILINDGTPPFVDPYSLIVRREGKRIEIKKRGTRRRSSKIQGLMTSIKRGPREELVKVSRFCRIKVVSFGYRQSFSSGSEEKRTSSFN